MNIVLIGLRGSGKTTVGRLLAERLKRPFLDSDIVLQEKAGETISAIFARGGEKLFRSMELQTVAECAANDNVIIACGGGVVLDPRNVATLRANGFVIHLTAEPEELYKRITADASSATTRPSLLAGAKSGLDEMKEIARARAAAYAQARHAEVPVADRTPDDIAAAVIELVK